MRYEFENDFINIPDYRELAEYLFLRLQKHKKTINKKMEILLNKFPDMDQSIFTDAIATINGLETAQSLVVNSLDKDYIHMSVYNTFTKEFHRCINKSIICENTLRYIKLYLMDLKEDLDDIAYARLETAENELEEFELAVKERKSKLSNKQLVIFQSMYTNNKIDLEDKTEEIDKLVKFEDTRKILINCRKLAKIGDELLTIYFSMHNYVRRIRDGIYDEGREE